MNKVVSELTCVEPLNRSVVLIRGFTLVELMAAVSVVAIMLMLSAPSFSEILANQRARRAAMDLYTSLVLARNEAIKRDTTVTISAKHGGWTAGWRIVNPSDNTKAIDDHGVLEGMTVTGPTGPATVSFGRAGRVTGNTPPSFTVSASDSPSVDERCIDLDLSGRPHIERKPEC
jgi:type IV fimbrial biogenesis protein FimT